MPISDCQKKYTKLFSGTVDKIVDPEKPNNPVYAIEADVTFAFTAQGVTSACNSDLICTESPAHFIIETDNPQALDMPLVTAAENIDLMAYVNTKIVFVQQHAKKQMKDLYHDVLMHKCQLEKKVIANALSTAITQPAHFGFQLTRKPGFIGVVAGEAISIVQCQPVSVTFRRTSTCYQEMPVDRDGKAYFMAPRTHILTQVGVRYQCSSVLPPMYFIANKWFKLFPEPIESKRPEIISPETRPTWKYADPKKLAQTGLYSLQQLESVRKALMFPIERTAILNSIARGMVGRNVTGDNINVSHLINADSIEKIFRTT